VGPVIQAGAAGIAVMSAILDAPDPARATAELRQALGRR
jgi:thiamine-phosphate pyrophosphorylase